MNFKYGETLFVLDIPCEAKEIFMLQQDNDRLLQDTKQSEIFKIRNEDELTLPINRALQLKAH